jgi:hypothetical protein
MATVGVDFGRPLLKPGNANRLGRRPNSAAQGLFRRAAAECGHVGRLSFLGLDNTDDVLRLEKLDEARRLRAVDGDELQ